MILDLAYQTGIRPHRVAGTAGGEYHSACPNCGGNDRFYIQPNKQTNRCTGYFRCRQCAISGDTITFAMTFLGYSFTQATQTIGVNAKYPYPILKKNYRPLTLEAPSEAWQQQAKQVTLKAHETLLNNQDALDCLAKRGITLSAIRQHLLGWHNDHLFFDRTLWGLEQSDKRLWVPEGLLIPYVDQFGNVLKLKARRSKWSPSDKIGKYIVISGSMNGLSIMGSSQHTTVVVVESELDAIAINAACEDFVCAIAVGSCLKSPDNLSDRISRKAEKLLICHDNDVAGTQMLAKWKRLYPHAISYATPQGKDVGEAIEKNLDIRDWLKQLL